MAHPRSHKSARSSRRLGVESLENRLTPAVQVLTINPATATAAAGSEVTFAVTYATTDAPNTDVNALTARVTFDSSKVSFTRVSNVLTSADYSLETPVTSIRTLTDSQNRDNNAATDKNITVSWLDSVDGPSFPGFAAGKSAPVKLFDVTFTTLATFTAGNTVFAAVGTPATNNTIGAMPTYTLTAGTSPPPTNNPPVAVADVATTVAPNPVVIDVLANDTDADANATKAISAVTNGTNGTAVVANGKVTYTPNAGFTGADTFTYTVTDGTDSATATVTVTVTGVVSNRNPVANPDAATTPRGTAVTVNVLGNDTDPDGNAITLSSASVPGHGTTQVTAGKVVYTPAVGFTGTDTFTYAIADGKGGTATGTVTVTVNTVTPPPINREVLVGVPQFATGPDVGTAGVVTLAAPGGTAISSVDPFPGFTGGIRTASADFNRDGVADIIAGTGPGRATSVRVFDGKTGALLFEVAPFEAAFTGGVYVAAGDLDGDGIPDLVITPDEGGGPRVDVFNGKAFVKTASFFGIDDPNFRGGARAAIADVNGDGAGDLIVAAGFGGGPRIAGFDGRTLSGTPVKVFADFFMFEQTLRNGVFITAGDLNGDGFADVIAGGGPGGGPRVFALSGAGLLAGTQTQVANFFAGDVNSRGGIRLAIKDLDGDAKADLVVGAGAGAGSRVTAYPGSGIAADGTPTSTLDFDAFAGSRSGVFVG